MKYSNVFMIFVLALLFGSTGAQASFKWSLCKKAFSKDDCRVYEKAYETLKDLQKAKETVDDLLKKNEDLSNQVKELNIKLFYSEVMRAEIVKQNPQLKSENAALRTERIRYQKFIHMFPAESH